MTIAPDPPEVTSASTTNSEVVVESPKGEEKMHRGLLSMIERLLYPMMATAMVTRRRRKCEFYHTYAN